MIAMISTLPAALATWVHAAPGYTYNGTKSLSGSEEVGTMSHKPTVDELPEEEDLAVVAAAWPVVAVLAAPVVAVLEAPVVAVLEEPVVEDLVEPVVAVLVPVVADLEPDVEAVLEPVVAVLVPVVADLEPDVAPPCGEPGTPEEAAEADDAAEAEEAEAVVVRTGGEQGELSPLRCR
jgi:hypothetical protein